MVHTEKDFWIYNDDCLQGLAKIESESVDLVVTDPPYFIDGMDDNWDDGKLNAKKSKAKVIGGLPVGMKFDPKQGIRLQEFMTQVAVELHRVLKKGAFMLSFSQGRLMHRMAMAIENAGFEIRDMLIWEHEGGMAKAFTQTHFVKKMNIPDSQKEEILDKLQERKTPQLRPKFEPIVLAQKSRQGTFVENWMQFGTGLVDIRTQDGTAQSTVFFGRKPKGRNGVHLAVKPVDVTERLIEVFSTPGQIVLDPFMGTGTTGVAAINTGRKFLGYEKEERYYELAKSRITESIDAIP